MLRENFESKGVEIVRQEILDGRYSDDGKKFAALVWLKEKGEQDRITARNRFRLTIAIAGLAALASVLKLFLK